MFFDNTVHQCQAKTCAFAYFFGGEKRIKNMIQFIFIDTTALIDDF